MAETTLIAAWLDRWEELNTAGRGVSPSEFAALHCVDAPPDLVKQFVSQAEKLASVDRHLRGKEPTAGDGSPDTPGGGGSPPTLTPDHEPVPGYRLVKRLGSGGYGTVWQAIAPGGFPVAMKFLDLGRQVGAVERQALELIKGLGHPHLLSVFAAFETDPWLIVACELADRTLADRLHECLQQGEAGVPEPEPLRHMQEAAEGLDHLNRSGIQHRDVKPSNLLLVGGSVKVGDFGLAKVLADSLASHSGSMTPAYAAPEFFDGKTTPHSYQYSLAVAYCEVRGGRLPFTGTYWELMQAHKQRGPDLSMVPAAERAVVARALSKQHGQRWPGCRAFVDALASAARAGEDRVREGNLERWAKSGWPESWVLKRDGAWGDTEWLALLAELRSSTFWPLDEASVAGVLEGHRQRLRERKAMTTNLRRWKEEKHADRWVEERGGVWDGDAWQGLLRSLKETSFWPIDTAEVGAALEECRARFLDSRLRAENLRRWAETGSPLRWVRARKGSWSHEEWVGLLEELERSGFWPLDAAAVGRLLERHKDEVRPRVENLRRWLASGEPRFWVRGHEARWGDEEWRSLRAGLERSDFWPLDAEAVGVLLEELKRTYREPGDRFVNASGMKFAWVPPGTFVMGSPAAEEGRGGGEVRHPVTLRRMEENNWSAEQQCKGIACIQESG